MELALQKHEAKAIYTALHALASIDAVLFYKIAIPDRMLSVTRCDGGDFFVSYDDKTWETYADVDAFRKAYRLRAISTKF